MPTTTAKNLKAGESLGTEFGIQKIRSVTVNSEEQVVVHLLIGMDVVLRPDEPVVHWSE
jgi:hypothetical protein